MPKLIQMVIGSEVTVAFICSIFNQKIVSVCVYVDIYVCVCIHTLTIYTYTNMYIHTHRHVKIIKLYS